MIWFAIIGSRPVSLWFNAGIQVEITEDYLTGSPVDRIVFLLLIIAALIVLMSRKVNWGEIFASNKLIFLFFLYWGISIIWSDYPFVSFKRWFKDLGNIVMIMIIVTEGNTLNAAKAIFVRFTYIVIPLSVLFIKYFPDIGRYYNRWTWEVAYSGITTHKNSLGCITLICGLFLIWDFIQMRTDASSKTDKINILQNLFLLSMSLWLLSMAESLTSLVCFIVGSGLLVFVRFLQAKGHVKYLGTYSLLIGLLFLFLYSMPGILETFVKMIGRDLTLTGRTKMWDMLLELPVNPIIGRGYQSFWLGTEINEMWETYYFHPNQAHNGYLETYLNGGLLGEFFLILIIISTGRKIKTELMSGNSYGLLFFSFFVVTIAYNWTEGIFNKMGPLWYIFLLITFVVIMPKNLVENSASFNQHTDNK